MLPWVLVDRARLPGADQELLLYRRGGEFAIRVAGLDLMTSRVHGSEEALAERACSALGVCPRVLVGGLGMGYTLAATLRGLGPDARVEVAELVPAVVAWNRTVLGELAGRPLDDPRVEVVEGDLGDLIRRSHGEYDAIMNDVDNGPTGLIRADNRWLYSAAGLAATWSALRPGGLLTVWSVGPDRSFTTRLERAGFLARSEQVRDRGGRTGRMHTLWIARRPGL